VKIESLSSDSDEELDDILVKKASAKNVRWEELGEEDDEEDEEEEDEDEFHDYRGGVDEYRVLNRMLDSYRDLRDLPALPE